MPQLPGGLPTWPTLVTLALVLSTWVLRGQAHRDRVSVKHAMDAGLLALVAGLLGARLLDALARGDWRLEGGFAWYGAMLGGSLAVLAFGARTVGALRLLATFSPAVMFGLAIARLGCLGAGCCHGVPTTLPWGLVYPSGERLHPSPVYESLGALLLCGALTHLPRVRDRVALFFGGYGALRFLVEFTRGDAGRGALLGLSTSQWLGALGVLVALVLVTTRNRDETSESGSSGATSPH